MCARQAISDDAWLLVQHANWDEHACSVAFMLQGSICLTLNSVNSGRFAKVIDKTLLVFTSCAVFLNALLGTLFNAWIHHELPCLALVNCIN